jgi:RNA 2',3'-cyclic 3'-phosphodiesterase
VKHIPHSNIKRIFIAVKIDPNDTLLSMISCFKTGLMNERIKWIETENFHATLAFLGDTAENMIKPVDKMLQRVCEGFGDFEMVIKGAGVFKTFKDPRVIWTGIEPSAKLNELYEAIKLGLKDTGITIEDRSFSPHLTLGRIKGINDNGILKLLVTKYMDAEIQKQYVSDVILYESILTHSGSVYKPIQKYHLEQGTFSHYTA